MVSSGYGVRAEGLQKHFGETHALRGVDLQVKEGSILGVLGPNGAGKTTAVRILTTLLKPDEGRAEVAGFDVLRHPDDVRRRIGLAGQYAALDEFLTGKENLEMIGHLYHLPRGLVRKRAMELLERFNLVDAGNRPVKTYSGGMRRRLDLAASLVASPPVLFLDEPTTGLDPRSRLSMWSLIEELVAGGTTLLLTTQYLDEADRLADEIAVIDEGRVIAHRHLGRAQDAGRRRATADHARRGQRFRHRRQRPRPFRFGRRPRQRRPAATLGAGDFGCWVDHPSRSRARRRGCADRRRRAPSSDAGRCLPDTHRPCRRRRQSTERQP